VQPCIQTEIFKIPFASDEQRIVEAVIKLGDWLLSQFELTEDQQSIIHRAQVLLGKGIFPPIGESFDYAVDASRDDLGRSWGIFFSSSELEIYSIYKPATGYVEQGGVVNEAALWHMMGQEDDFIWKIGASPYDEPYDVSRWIDETSDPEKYEAQGFQLDFDMGWLA
jgi:hypothetical protein